MLQSMTAYGSLEFEHNSKRISIEIRSVNHRYFDLRIKSPSEFLKLENNIRKVLKDKLDRGSIDCFIRSRISQSTTDQNKKLSVDKALLEQYFEAIQDIKYEHKIKGSVELSDILRIKDIFILDEAEGKDEKLGPVFIKNLSKCADIVLAMQEQEGVALRASMIRDLSKIEEHTKTIEQRTVNSYKDYFEKIKEKINTLLDSPQISQDRIITEAGILAERNDIKEEIDRLYSHISQFQKEMDHQSSSVGKKLDFIVQEINREINTIASKSDDKDVVYIAVENKTLTEKIREQIQNVK